MKDINQILGKTDIYLIDQIVKGRYQNSDVILDAGCGQGRNLHWFYNNEFTIYGIDANEDNIEKLKKIYPKGVNNFSVSKIEELNFKDDFFNHIICNAVMHFANNETHFIKMFDELMRVLKSKGTLFIRVASDIGIRDKIKHISNGVYKLPDGTNRYLVSKTLLKKLNETNTFKLLEPLKTVNVNDLRCMTTLVIQKK